MTELIATIGTGVAVASVVVAGQRGIRAELRDRFTAVDARLTAIERQHGELRERIAHLEGLLDGLREAITGKRGAA